MIQQDYYIEYYEELDRRLESFFSSSEIGKKSTRLAGFQVKEPLTTFLFYKLTMERDNYSFCRRQGMPVESAMSRVDAFLDRVKMVSTVREREKDDILTDLEQHPWSPQLKDCKGCVLFYVFNPRQLGYLIPLFYRMNRPVVLLSEYDIPENTKLPEYATVLPVHFSKRRIFTDKEFEDRFPLLFHYAHTFSILLQMLQPIGVVCLEGCHFQEQLLAVEAEHFNIPSYGIQQGWPSLIRTGFRRMPFRYFYTWGERFSELWAAYNSFPRFVSSGYMYETAISEEEEQKCVSFFLQSPTYLSDENYFNALLKLIEISADKFPDVLFLVREHPEYKLGEKILRQWNSKANVEIVSDCDLTEVYVRTRIVVSHYSSSLMEGLQYGCQPLVFDPTCHSHYYPDIEKERMGKIACSAAEFFECLGDMLKNTEWNFVNKPKWFAAMGMTTLNAMTTHLNKTLNKSMH